MACLINPLTYPYLKDFENFLILSMIIIVPLSIPSRVILIVLELRLIQFPCLVDKEEDFVFKNPNKTVLETTLIKRTYVQWAGPSVFRINTVPASLSS